MNIQTRALSMWLALGCGLGAACSGTIDRPGPGQPGPGQPGPGPVKPAPIQPPAPVTATLLPEQRQEVGRLQAIVSANQQLSADQLLASRQPPFKAALGYDPRKAVNLGLIQASALKLDEAELSALGTRGFVVSDNHRYPHFAYGYKTIYAEDLPVFISADAILQAVHQSYDDILKAIELTALVPELEKLLTGMRARLAAPTLDARTRDDADLFLAVALALLQPPAIAGGRADVKALVDLAQAGAGSKEMVLFGANREIDFSQFKPRGHYKGDARLERYFRAMMWLGRIDLPLLQTDPNTGKPMLARASVATALGLRALMDADAMARWTRMDRTVRAFVGEPDSMGPLEVDRLKAALGITGDALGDVSDEKIAAAIVAGGFGKQRILSQIVMQAPHAGETWPLDATFTFFGQRYVFDSHVFSNVVYDRVSIADAPKRMMPDPLDVAYAALGNDQAAALLGPSLTRHRYAPALETIRRLGDEHGTEFWTANLYNLWLGALRTLSPGPDLAKPGSGLPAVAATEAWGRRLLSTQLSSWAQLRHDTLLYAKQSYSTGLACEFPDAYVDPYPAFFAALEKFAATGAQIAADLALSTQTATPGEPAPFGPPAAGIRSYFERLGRVTGILREMAEHQRTGVPHKAEHLAFINQAVAVHLGCAGPAGVGGWYAELFFSPGAAVSFDPTIADVHTQPSDEAGARVDRVLHVGTGYPRLMVVTIETCMGPRAYAGVVSSYHELVTERLERLDDVAWATRFSNGAIPADVPWMKDLITK